MAAALAGAAQAQPRAELEAAVLAQINYVRAHPAEYAEQLRQGPETPATEEAAEYLEAHTPAPPLQPIEPLAASASYHAFDQDRHGEFEHRGSDGSTPGQRMRKEGVWAMIFAEEMAAGEEDASAFVRDLIIDEDVPDRGHRKDLMDPLLRRAGVGCAPHPTYGEICVIDLASAQPPRD